MTDLTMPQRLICAGFRLEESGQCPFAAEALVVRAWKDNREAFGLAGFEHLYPDANKVLYNLMGARGLVSRGWFVQREKGKKLYELSRQSRDEARVLLGSVAQRRTLGKIQVSEDVEVRLCSLLRCRAYSRWRSGGAGEVAVEDAKYFLSLDPAGTVEKSAQALVSGQTALRCGGVATAADLDGLRRCRDALLATHGKRLGMSVR